MFEREPCKAAPIATPIETIAAAMLVVSMPIYPKKHINARIFSAFLDVVSTTPERALSILRLLSDFAILRHTMFITLKRINNTMSPSKMRSPSVVSQFTICCKICSKFIGSP